MSRRIEVRAQGIASDEASAFVDKIFVSVGQTVERDAPLLSIELSKTSIEAFAPEAGRVKELLVAANATVRDGELLLILESIDVVEPAIAPPAAAASESRAPDFHASPWIRVLARERGIDLALIVGSGPHGRILESDLPEGAHPGSATSAVAPVPVSLSPVAIADAPVASSGASEARPLSSLQRAVARNLVKNWTEIPHVTQFDEVDITELEAFRIGINQERKSEAPKLSLLPFIVKASACALAAFPDFNGTLSGEQLIVKRDIHVGFAVDTGDGLRVPVVRHADRLSILQIAAEIARLAESARAARLASSEVQGGSFTISNLGGVGGTAFTPIVNAPEVAILGVSKSAMKPHWDGSAFVPRLMLPLSLSYDHRVINGMAGARFVTYLGSLLSDMRRALL